MKRGQKMNPPRKFQSQLAGPPSPPTLSLSVLFPNLSLCVFEGDYLASLNPHLNPLHNHTRKLLLTPIEQMRKLTTQVFKIFGPQVVF